MICPACTFALICMQTLHWSSEIVHYHLIKASIAVICTWEKDNSLTYLLDLDQTISLFTFLLYIWPAVPPAPSFWKAGQIPIHKCKMSAINRIGKVCLILTYIGHDRQWPSNPLTSVCHAMEKCPKDASLYISNRRYIHTTSMLSSVEQWFETSISHMGIQIPPDVWKQVIVEWTLCEAICILEPS